ncbi:MAG TPA: RdgB/HAM1 family non-canonical purine NTP pyrophosphatase [Candidatus Thalassarchaeaceae archaeon]|nr:MAG TPA: RdgB/HAM1 family non-canonical purine NTP pyrophosphatase [Candidatus Poseidoniales archaeon]HII48908.1 RdgB/HAM1 family non-canonical purine NTP pyrophosphatase [Candidatus Thalassarchaeaceae archaeon]|tara:strand:- start:1291 stop:1890 length:600 start_codon:yes stop_codon:yes gene_type:complete
MVEMKRILFLTSNEGKLREAKHALEPWGYEIVSIVGGTNKVQLVEVQARDLVTVALSKIEQAESYVENAHQIDGVMVEDAGFFIDAHPNFPGVYSAHILESLGLEGILRLMRGRRERGAEFQSTIVLQIESERFVAQGSCRGRLSEEIRGDGGFGYDPLFIPEDGDGRTFAEMSIDEKKALSHRGHAMARLVTLLEDRG